MACRDHRQRREAIREWVTFCPCGEADGYAKKQERSGITAEIVCDGEEANVEVNGEKIRFRHGDCVLFNWRPIAGGNE